MAGAKGTGGRPSTARSQLRTLAVLGAVLAVVAVAAALVPRLTAEEGEESATASLLSLSADDISTITWAYDGAQSQVSSEDGTWTDTAGGAELDQDAVQAVADALASATTSRTIDAADEVDDMGLTEPQASVDITCADGSKRTLEIGAATSDEASYYVRVDGADDIELMDAASAETLFCDLTTLYAMESAPQSTGVRALSLETAGATVAFTYHEGGSDASYTDEYTWYADDGDGAGERPVEASEVESLVYDVNNVTWASCVDPDYDGSTDYGLEEPTLVATLDYVTQTTENVGDTNDDGYGDYETVETPGTFVLVIGDKVDGTSAYYAQPQGSSKVYTVWATAVEDLFDVELDDLRPDDVLLMDWTTVDAIDVTADGVTKTIELAHEQTETDADGDGELDVETTYTVDGAEADADDVEALLDALDALASEGTDDAATAGEAEVTFVFHRNTETFAEMTFALSRYDNSFYLLSFDGASRLLINRQDVEELRELIDAL